MRLELRPLRARLTTATRATLATLLAAGLVACADATSPTEGSKVLENPGGSPSTNPDTSGPRTFDRHRYAGRVVWPSTDSLRAWSAVAGVRVELVRVNAENGDVVPVASGLTDVDGRYVIDDPTRTPQGLLAIRAVPDASLGFRASPLAFPLIDVPENGRYSTLGLARADAPAVAVPVPPVTGQVLDAPAWGAYGPAVPGVVLAFRKILSERYPEGDTIPDRVLSTVVEYGVADAQGRFAVALSQGPGSYLMTTTPPAGYYTFTPRDLGIWVGAQDAATLAPHPLVLRLGKTGG